MRGSYQMQSVMPLTPVVKKLIIFTVAVWLIGVVIIQNLFMEGYFVNEWLGMVPAYVVAKFYIWQPLTYMFVHSSSPFHIVFNMLILWMFGSELERQWGGKLFLTYYLVTGVGAGLIYSFLVAAYTLLSGNQIMMMTPVVGSSGAGFGLLLAYGLLFGERVIYFMMLFPMKAKWFVTLLAGIELVSLLGSGGRSGVANLAHLGGLVSGWAFLIGYSRWKQRKSQKKRKGGARLKLVVDNEPNFDNKDDGPKYWN
ncbi:MAG: rhomboid family intramembrane serine protease [Bdellovibrionales bacterium]|nr:rhomboid family intramembrane serine protease [Bdellovibrionales bacterium]